MQNQTPFGGLTSNSHRLTIVRPLVYRVAQFPEKTGNDQFGNWLSFYTFRITQPYTLFLFASKTDFFKKNVTLFIIVINNKIYVMILLKHLFIYFFTNSNFFLFQTFVKFLFIHDIFIDKIKKILLQHDYQNNYLKHLFKKNVIIFVKITKLSNNEIQLLK